MYVVTAITTQGKVLEQGFRSLYNAKALEQQVQFELNFPPQDSYTKFKEVSISENVPDSQELLDSKLVQHMLSV